MAAFLTGLMILLFLGSWRSTIIVCISIPLSILTSLAVLNLLHETINVMTLGGLALAVGILVDDATVEIENIHRNLGQRKPIIKAILDGAQQIAVPAFVSTLCICIVFVPVIFLSGAARLEVERQLQYPEDTAGELMTTEFVRLDKSMTVGQALDHIRQVAKTRETIYACYIVEAGSERLQGVVSLRDLVLSDSNRLIGAVMRPHPVTATSKVRRPQLDSRMCLASA